LLLKTPSPHNMEKLSPLKALWAALFITALSPLFGKMAADMSPVMLILAANFISIFYFAPELTKNKQWSRLFEKGIRFKLSMIGLFGTALPFMFLLISLKYTTPANSAILNQTEVIYSLILTYIFLKERPTAKQLLGTLMIIAGAAAILLGEKFTPRWKGDLIVIFTVWMFQVSHIFAKKLPQELSSDFIAGGRAVFAFLWCIPLAFASKIFGFGLHIGFSFKAFAIILFMGFLTYGLKNSCWYRAIRNMDISKATAVILSYPVFTYAFSIMCGMDKLHIYQFCGLVLALAGAYTVTEVIKSAEKKI